jgi:hypothetical protein
LKSLRFVTERSSSFAFPSEFASSRGSDCYRETNIVTRGTSKLKKELRADYDLIIERPEELEVCGLEEPTRFDLDDAQNLVPCDWSSDFFPDPNPVGRLNLNCIRRMENRLRGWNRVPDKFKQK